MIAPPGAKGDVVPMSTTKPLFLVVLFQVTVVPVCTQKRVLLLGLEVLAVAEALLAVRFTSTTHGFEAEPHVLAALQSCAGLGSEHAYLLFFDWGSESFASRKSGRASKEYLKAEHR
jgi:hypothetical protein